MPLYEYKCECGELCEIIQHRDLRDVPVVCRKCASPMKRTIGVPEVFVKGGTRNINPLKYPSLKERMGAKLYGDDPGY